MLASLGCRESRFPASIQWACRWESRPLAASSHCQRPRPGASKRTEKRKLIRLSTGNYNARAAGFIFIESESRRARTGPSTDGKGRTRRAGSLIINCFSIIDGSPANCGHFGVGSGRYSIGPAESDRDASGCPLASAERHLAPNLRPTQMVIRLGDDHRLDSV